MVETGDYFDIRFQTEPRYKKPVGIYWLQAAAVHLSGDGAAAPIWIYRLPSFLAAIGSACAVWWMALAFGRPRAALLAGLMMASCLVLGVEARLAKTDAALLLTSTVALGVLARAYVGRGAPLGRWLPFLFWTALGLGILIKGPIGPGLVALAALALSVERGDLRWLAPLRPALGAVWMLLLALPWFIAITATSGLTFFRESVGRDMLQKVSSGVESHGAPPGTYALLALVTFWPGSIALVPAIRSIFDRLRDPAIRFALLSGVPLFLIFEALPTKLPHYVLPVYPLIALAVATALDEGGGRVRGWLTGLASFGGATMAAALAVASVLLSFHFGEPLPIAGLAILVPAVAIGMVAGLVYRHSAVAGSTFAVAGALVTYLGVFGFVLPGLEALRLSERLVAAGRAVLTCPEPEFASAGFGEPSLVFIAGTKTVLGGGDDAADFLAGGGCRLAFVDRRELESFNSRIDDLGLDVVGHGTVFGYNLSKDRTQRMELYTLAGAPR
nr:glycosyltransferase family 39 protein [Prosthecomicrobium pneumaticum]